MGEPTQDLASENHSAFTFDRRSFLKGLGLSAGYLASLLLGLPRSNVGAQESLPFDTQTPEQKTEAIQRLTTEIGQKSLQELQYQVFQLYPVVPNVELIMQRLRQITEITPGSSLMKAGTSVASGMLENVFGSTSNPVQINLGSEQHKVQKVLEYFHVAPGALELASLAGVDIPQLLYDPLICDMYVNTSANNTGMTCLPNVGVIDSYIEYFHPKVAVNFVGTNLVRNNASLEQFGARVQQLIEVFISKNVMPVLTTFPHPPNDTDEMYQSWFENPYVSGDYIPVGKTLESVKDEEKKSRSLLRPENALKYNLLLLKMAELYSIPIINIERGIVESVLNNGVRLPNESRPEIDPVHVTMNAEIRPFTTPATGEKFYTAEDAVSYFAIQTLYQLIPQS